MTRIVKRHRGLVGLFVTAAVLTGPATAVWAQTKAKAPDKPKGDVVATVVIEGNKALKSCTIYAKGQRATAEKAGVPVTLKGVTAGKVSVTAEATVADQQGPLRYLGVTTVTVEAGKAESVTVTLVPVADIDSYCMGCHPDNRDPKVKVLPGQIVKDIHKSNLALGEKYLAQVKVYNETAAKLEKEGKPHNLPMPLEERVVVVDGKQTKRLFYTCETCHTLHWETSWTKYARAPYRTKSDLCVGCHY